MIVAFRSDTHGFIVADSALTNGGSDALFVGPVSSFGEPHFRGESCTVEEVALKILRVRNEAWGFAGDVNAIRRAASLIRKLGPLKRKMVRESIARDLATAGELELVWVYFDGTSPRVESWSPSEGWQEAIFAVAGSAASKNQLVGVCSQLALRTVAPTHGLPLEDFQLDPSIRLALFQAGLQAISVKENLIAEGVGGCLVGAMVGPTGFEWQDDQCHLLFEDGALEQSAEGADGAFSIRSTVVREGVAFVHPVLNRANEWTTRALWPLGRTSKPSHRAWRAAKSVIAEGRYRLTTLMRTGTCTPFVLHSAGRRTEEFVVLDPDSNHVRLRRWIPNLVEGAPSFGGLEYGVAVSLVLERERGESTLMLAVAAYPGGSDWIVLAAPDAYCRRS